MLKIRFVLGGLVLVSGIVSAVLSILALSEKISIFIAMMSIAISFIFMGVNMVVTNIPLRGKDKDDN